MVLPTGVNGRYASTAIFILAVLWIWVALDRPYSIPSHISWDIYSNRPTTSPSLNVFEYPPIRSAAFQEICANATFDSSVTFVCDDAPGDVTEVRNSILSCVRYAMKVGADLVMPRITMREDYSREKKGNSTSLDYMFDPGYFVQSLDHFCPDMRIYESEAEVLRQKDVLGRISLVPGSLVKPDAHGQIPQDEWKSAFDSWLAKQIPDSGRHIIMELAHSFLQYPVWGDDADFAVSFGKILKFRYDIGTLATMTLVKLSSTLQTPFDIGYPIIPESFLGVHLSTQMDPTDVTSKVDQANYQYLIQSQLYLDQAVSSNITAIYTSSDSTEDLSAFHKDAEALGISVFTKFDLLKGQDRATLLDLTLDQQKLVDFLVLYKASGFLGVSQSSLAWNVALHRHKFAQQVIYLDGPEAFSDDLSQVYGRPKSHTKFSAGMWP
ncbi:hypothetical protein BJ875DRAFT_233309 [Amylocarpus encephaloides]|uniref:Alternative oxidase n=1 Tax=Amylocarpus encephaloides TaxID=45428 RepID=A0A9P7Y7H5_9HELO|nr:hypothetical protein BJ875DRAFT_233309 [Amylocarpus encephaloides]